MSGTGESLIRAATAAESRERRYAARKRTNQVALALSLLAMAFGVFWLLWILFETVRLGVGGLSLSLFTQMTPPPNETGGLANALWGSFLMVLLATFIATPIGILAGIYLAEYDTKGWLAQVTRFVNDILLSAPSIVIGLFVYEIMVRPFHGFSAIAGAVALAIIAMPIVTRTTEDILSLQPGALREAGMALGASRAFVIRKVVWKSARAGLITGALLGFARISGETAPLLFTALGNQFFSVDPTQPMASLPTTIFQFALSAYEDWQRLAWVGALLIAVAVLSINIIGRVVAREARR